MPYRDPFAGPGKFDSTISASSRGFSKKRNVAVARLLGLALTLFGAWNQSQAQQSLQVLHNHLPSAVSSGQAVPIASLSTDQNMRFSIVLPLRNQSELTSLLGRLYDPSSPDYRHFVTVQQFTDQFGPTAEDYQAVVSFAQANGLTVTDTPANRLIVPHQRLGSADQPGLQPDDEGLPASDGEPHVLCARIGNLRSI